MKTKHLPEYSPRVVFRSSTRCNYRCRMCYWGNPESAAQLESHDVVMSMDLFEKALNQAVPYIDKFGLPDSGEFMMDPYWKERLAMIANKCREYPGLMFHQITNASLLTPNNLKYMKGIRNATFLISIDSVEPLNYADIRRGGNLGNVLSNLRDLRQNLAEIGVTNVAIQLSMVLMKRNIHEVPELIQLAKELDANLFTDHMQGLGSREMASQSLFYYPMFTNQYLDKCRQFAERLKVPFYAPPPFAITTTEIDQYHKAKKDKKLSCPSLDDWSPISIQPNGDVHACCGNLVFGNLNDKSFQDIFFSEKFDFYRKAIQSGLPPSPCNSCRFLHMSMPYLYESLAYDLNIPPENQNMDIVLDFRKEGFYDWLDKIPVRKLRHQLSHYLNYRLARRFTNELDEFIQAEGEEIVRREQLLRFIQQQSKVIVYPAGSRANELLNKTELSYCNIVAFSDKDPMKQGLQFNGHEVIPPSSIVSLKPDVVFIACSQMLRKQILSELAYLGGQGIQLIAI